MFIDYMTDLFAESCDEVIEHSNKSQFIKLHKIVNESEIGIKELEVKPIFVNKDMIFNFEQYDTERPY